jgi:hypothetical protein
MFPRVLRSRMCCDRTLRVSVAQTKRFAISLAQLKSMGSQFSRLSKTEAQESTQNYDATAEDSPKNSSSIAAGTGDGQTVPYLRLFRTGCVGWEPAGWMGWVGFVHLARRHRSAPARARRPGAAFRSFASVGRRFGRSIGVSECGRYL